MIGPTVALWVHLTAWKHSYEGYRFRCGGPPPTEETCFRGFVQSVSKNGCIVGYTRDEQSTRECLQRLQIEKTEELIRVTKAKKP